MINKNNKKGAIEMSLNLIIMLIIGLVVMGLVIGFVTNLVGQGSSTFGTELDKAEEAEFEKVINSPGVFVVGPTNLKISSGGSKRVFVKIYNPTDDDLAVGKVTSGDIVDTEVVDSGDGFLSFMVSAISISDGCTIDVQSAPVNIEAKETEGIKVAISPSRNCDPGDEFFISVAFKPTADVTKTETISAEIVE